MRIPRVTVGMPAYNRAIVLRHTIQQVLEQTFKDLEFIIYNDGSTDNTSEIIQSFQDERIIFLDRPNLGPPHPLNIIYSLAKGDYIIILHDHDFFHPQLLEESVAALDRNPGVGFVLQGSAWIGEDGMSNYQAMLHDLPEVNSGREFGEKMLEDQVSFSSIFHACSMVRREALVNVGMYYIPEFGLYADTDLWLRLLNSYDFVYLKKVLFKFRTRESEGHFLSNRQCEILDWQYQIQKKNIEYYFRLDRKKVALLSQKLEQKYKIHQLKLAIQSLSKKNRYVWQNTLKSILVNEYQPSVVKWLLKICDRVPLHNLLLTILPLLNTWRKKLLKR